MGAVNTAPLTVLLRVDPSTTVASMQMGRVWRAPYRPDLSLLAGHRRGAGDPTYRIVGGRHWRGLRTPQGAATLAVHLAGDEVHARAWGDGADWALDAVPGLLGAYDQPEDLVLRDERLVAAALRHGVPRFGRSGLVWESLVASIIEQKVTGQEAFAGFRRLVQRYGEPAPGPGADQRLWIQPTPEQIRRIPSWAWLRMPVDPARSRTVVAAARVAGALERTAGLPGAEAGRRLRTIPGVGEWTAAEVRQRSHGDPDAVSFGDFHVAKDIGHALTGAAWDDDALRAFLEPYYGQRHRVVALIYRAAGSRPRHGPRLAPRTHLPA